MGQSKQPHLWQIRGIYRLLAEVCERGQSVPVWRKHLLRGLLELVDADLGHAGEAPLCCSPVSPRFEGIEIDGPTEPPQLAAYHWLIHERDYTMDPTLPVISKLLSKSFTRTRQQLVSDRMWYRRPDLDAWQTLGADNFVYSHQFLAIRRCIHLVSINRVCGRRAFSERERLVVALFHSELGKLWRQPLSDETRNLSPRLSQTLNMLLAGDYEKNIAKQLNLSRHTVHDYIKALYHRYGVSSQPELMARLLPRPLWRGPQLCIDRHPPAPRPGSRS